MAQLLTSCSYCASEQNYRVQFGSFHRFNLFFFFKLHSCRCSKPIMFLTTCRYFCLSPLSLSHTHTLSLSFSFSLFLSHTHTHTHTLSLSPTFIFFHDRACLNFRLLERHDQEFVHIMAESLVPCVKRTLEVLHLSSLLKDPRKS